MREDEMNTETPKQKPILIYIAGPYRAATTFEIEENIHRAKKVGAQVLAAAKEMGVLAIPVIPHTMLAHLEGADDDELFIEGTLELMRRCDGVLMVEGWEESEGACAEHEEAWSTLCVAEPGHMEDMSDAEYLIGEIMRDRSDSILVTGLEEQPPAADENVDAIAQAAADFHELAGQRIGENERRIEELTQLVRGRIDSSLRQEAGIRRREFDRAFKRIGGADKRIVDMGLSLGMKIDAHRDALNAEITAIKQRLNILTAQTAE